MCQALFQELGGTSGTKQTKIHVMGGKGGGKGLKAGEVRPTVRDFADQRKTRQRGDGRVPELSCSEVLGRTCFSQQTSLCPE